jgi:hypothetical protein
MARMTWSPAPRPTATSATSPVTPVSPAAPVPQMAPVSPAAPVPPVAPVAPTAPTAPVTPVGVEPSPVDPTPAAEAGPPAGTTQAGTAPAARRPGEVVETPIALWSDEAAERLRDQWRDLQVRFVDDPAAAVTGAKGLVTEAVQQLAETLLAAQAALDPFRETDQVDTEAMRVAMRRYREFLDRVLAL